MKPMSGILGEVEAARYLRENGYTMMAANFNCRFGELDMVAEKDGILAIVEVKSRLENAWIAPIEAVDKNKIARIKLAADVYLKAEPFDGDIRFDVIEVLFNVSFEVVMVNHIQNTFI